MAQRKTATRKRSSKHSRPALDPGAVRLAATRQLLMEMSREAPAGHPFEVPQRVEEEAALVGIAPEYQFASLVTQGHTVKEMCVMYNLHPRQIRAMLLDLARGARSDSWEEVS